MNGNNVCFITETSYVCDINVKADAGCVVDFQQHGVDIDFCDETSAFEVKDDLLIFVSFIKSEVTTIPCFSSVDREVIMFAAHGVVDGKTIFSVEIVRKCYNSPCGIVIVSSCRSASVFSTGTSVLLVGAFELRFFDFRHTEEIAPAFVHEQFFSHRVSPFSHILVLSIITIILTILYNVVNV